MGFDKANQVGGEPCSIPPPALARSHGTRQNDTQGLTTAANKLFMQLSLYIIYMENTMAIHFITSDAKHLLSRFDAHIVQDSQTGKITTWIKSNDGVYYTHKSSDWTKKAWFKPTIESDRLTFNIIKPKDKKVTPLVYAYYHGHIMETFLNHFDNLFSTAVTSSLAERDDNC
ncbi:hypothetical protein [Acidithiobacillus ferriphilus]|uniref:hypothetical protein n=1 Tax=Acidithiobacillus ferriphilus TaxID=1689834 RepID=UPI001E29F8DC|nr:hypothetical protein [Acidithiobacillus ferriphilus]